MKTIAKKGQYAVPIILLAIAGLFFVYLIMVYAEERQRILGVPIEEINESPLGPETELIFSSGQINEIGRATAGEVAFSFAIENFDIDYGKEEKVLTSLNDVTVSGSIISSGTQKFLISNLNMENTKELTLFMNITEIRGTPRISVYLNESLIFQKDAQTGTFSISIPKELLKETENPITIKIEHNGIDFWSKHSVTFSKLSVKQIYYDPTNSIYKEVIPITESNYQGNTFKLSFKAKKAVTEGDLIIKVNGKQIWSGKPIENETTTITVRLEDSNIKVGDNEIVFEAGKGGEYSLTKVLVEFIAKATPEATKTYSFDIPKEYLESNRDILIGIRIDRIITPGSLYFSIDPYSTYYYFSSADIASGAWSYAKIDKTKLKQFGNKITLSSPDGRFKISGFVVVLV